MCQYQKLLAVPLAIEQRGPTLDGDGIVGQQFCAIAARSTNPIHNRISKCGTLGALDEFDQRKCHVVVGHFGVSAVGLDRVEKTFCDVVGWRTLHFRE